MKFARIVSDTACDVRTESPDGFFHPDIAAQFVEVPDGVENGWTLKDGIWSAPVIPEPPTPEPVAPVLPILSSVQFKMCFTALERIALKALRQNDPVIDDWMTILDDPRLSGVDLNLASTQAAVDYLVGKVAGFDAARAAQVKAGQVL